MKKIKKMINISIIIPFYDGNIFLPRLFSSIENVIAETFHIANFEVVIVNDSPQIPVELPKHEFEVKVISNSRNLGIQKARINGLNKSTGEWIIFLDQDDELVTKGFQKQIELTDNADVVVGNGIYMMGTIEQLIYNNQSVMDYLIQKKNFFKIRNLIPSPGECLIRKSAIPIMWIDNHLEKNGADDWMLWLLLFKENARYCCNDKVVYIHNDTNGGNLSSNLQKMRESSIEMTELLSNNKMISRQEKKTLCHAIDFKFLQDTKQLNLLSIIKYSSVFIDNVIYRININLLGTEND